MAAEEWLLGCLGPVEEQAVKAQQAEAPRGHLVAGPFDTGWRWRCVSCGRRWSDGVHDNPGQHSKGESITKAEGSPWWSEV